MTHRSCHTVQDASLCFFRSFEISFRTALSLRQKRRFPSKSSGLGCLGSCRVAVPMIMVDMQQLCTQASSEDAQIPASEPSSAPPTPDIGNRQIKREPNMSGPPNVSKNESETSKTSAAESPASKIAQSVAESWRIGVASKVFVGSYS